MRNSQFTIRNSKSLCGFTLAEMLVAVAMGAALVAAAAGVFSLASEAIGTSEANTEINSQLRVLYAWLDHDFARIRLDGPLVIMFNNIDYSAPDGTPANARLDRVLFSISGDIPSLTTSDHVGSALVLYGQDITADSLSSPTYEDMFGLTLTRWGRLIMSDASPPAGNTEFYPGTASYADFLAYWYSTATPGDNFIASFTVRPDITTNGVFAQMIDHIISFGVIAYGMPDGTTVVDLTASPPANGSQTRFGPTDTKPAWIEFEIVLRDRNNRLAEGFTAVYRVNLPSR